MKARLDNETAVTGEENFRGAQVTDVKKTKAQLDREIAEALAGDAYYYVIDRRANRTLYGPFATRKEAEYAGYFAKPVSERDSQPANRYFNIGVQRFDADEIRSLRDTPRRIRDEERVAAPRIPARASVVEGVRGLSLRASRQGLRALPADDAEVTRARLLTDR